MNRFGPTGKVSIEKISILYRVIFNLSPETLVEWITPLILVIAINLFTLLNSAVHREKWLRDWEHKKKELRKVFWKLIAQRNILTKMEAVYVGKQYMQRE